jgi:hypothetical protein
VPLVDWDYLVEEWWPHILLEVVVVMAHHSCRFATPGGLTLLIALSPLVVSGLFGKKANAPGPPRAIPDMGLDRALLLSNTI